MARRFHLDGEPIRVDGRLERLTETLATVPGLAGVYLFGSYATAHQTPLSDVDLALIFERGRVPDERQELELQAAVVEVLGVEDVSLAVLNRAPLAFQFKVLSEGRRLAAFDEIACADFLEEVIDRYADFAIDERRFHREYDRAFAADHSDGRR